MGIDDMAMSTSEGCVLISHGKWGQRETNQGIRHQFSDHTYIIPTRLNLAPRYFQYQMYWYPGGAANNSTTCVEEEGDWEDHRYTGIYTTSAFLIRRVDENKTPQFRCYQRTDAARSTCKIDAGTSCDALSGGLMFSGLIRENQ